MFRLFVSFVIADVFLLALLGLIYVFEWLGWLS